MPSPEELIAQTCRQDPEVNMGQQWRKWAIERGALGAEEHKEGLLNILFLGGKGGLPGGSDCRLSVGVDHPGTVKAAFLSSRYLEKELKNPFK